LEALDWQEDVKALGQVFNKVEVADAWLANYNIKAKEAGEQLKEIYGENTSYLSFLASGGQFYVFDGAGFGSVLYQDMGLNKPEGMPEQSDISLPVVTYEGLASIRSDYIFVLATEEDLKVLKENTIWNSLPAVKEGRVLQLSASPYFIQGYSSIGREVFLDEIVEMLNETN
jgi:iron complex transport system substrate-binding protein